MMNTKIKQSGFSVNGNFHQNLGTENFNLQIGPALKKAQIYDCLESFIKNNDISPNKEMDISTLPAELNKKLCFNHAGKYINLFKDYYLDITAVGEVISEGFPNGELIISSLKSLFYNAIPNIDYNDDGSITVKDGSAILDKLFETISERINHDPRYKNDQISLEVIERFVYSFIGYGVSICQVLLNPNKKG
ncbi:hypothetical protein QU408_03585 [Lactobacillus crispatus]|uniref:hypothetical protein n=1 Tax=Lactobacillus crispatus TaxID=47770 RepID=UPI003D6C5880